MIGSFQQGRLAQRVTDAADSTGAARAGKMNNRDCFNPLTRKTPPQYCRKLAGGSLQRHTFDGKLTRYFSASTAFTFVQGD
jgi:hypothetical protein